MAKRFHDEFFRKTTPDHDNLVVYCLSEEFQNQLIEILKINNYIKQYKFVRKSKVWECEKCSIEGYTDDKKCFLTWCRDYDDFSGSFYCYRNSGDFCKNFNGKDYNIFGGRVKSNGHWIRGIIQTDTYEIENVDKETEKICRSGTFIIGYIDVFYDVRVSYQCRLLGSRDDSKRDDSTSHIWENFSQKSENLGIVIEVKPKINSWGGFLRQIKTYMETTLDEENSYNTIIGLLVTYDQLSPKEIKTLKNEDVLYLNVSKKDIKDGLDKFLEKE